MSFEEITWFNVSTKNYVLQSIINATAITATTAATYCHLFYQKTISKARTKYEIFFFFIFYFWILKFRILFPLMLKHNSHTIMHTILRFMENHKSMLIMLFNIKQKSLEFLFASLTYECSDYHQHAILRIRT